MRERGIIFNAEMVRAILDGRKTQTRRIMKADCMEVAEMDDGSLWPWRENGETCEDYWYSCPFGVVGDLLWVRETWQAIHDYCDENGNVDERRYPRSIPKQRGNYWHPVYAESWGNECREDRQFPWRPAIHMPRWASRITLEIVSIRVERLNDISEADAKAEGISPAVGGVENGWEHRFNFRELWMTIYGEDNWQINPWVWVVEFKRVEQLP